MDYQPAVTFTFNMAKAQVFSRNKGNHFGFMKLLF